MRIGCAEMAGVVENLWNAGFAVQSRGFWLGWCGNLLFHVEQFSGADGGKRLLCSTWNVIGFPPPVKRLIDLAIHFSDAGAAGG
jgi:hypothetical protein